MPDVITSLRDGRFLTPARLRVYPLLFLIAFAAALAGLAITAHGLNDYAARPLGSDFASFFAAGRLTLAGHSPYDQIALQKMEQALFGANTGFYSFSYPPIFLLPMTVLAHLPYRAALAIWQLGTLALYAAGLMRLRRRHADVLPPGAFVIAALGFTAVFVNLTHGQTGFLSAALFAFALSLLEENAVLAGVCLGLAAFKPQLGLMVPVALAAGGHWRAFAAAAVTVAALALVSTSLFGIESWNGFLAAAQFSRQAILENDAVGYQKMISPFAALRLWQAPVAPAYAVQAIAALAAAMMLWRIWRGDASFADKGAALCLASLIATPFSLDYDLMLTAPAIALLAAQGARRGFAPYEVLLLASLWLLPVAERQIAGAIHLPLAALFLPGLLTLVWRRTQGFAAG